LNPGVKKATPDQNYTVHLIFDNGEEGKIKVLGNKRELIDVLRRNKKLDA